MSSVTTLISRIRRRLEDPNSLHWPDTEVVGAINEAKNDLFDYIFLRNKDCLEATAVEYTWAADVMSVDLDAIVSDSIGTYEILLITTTPTTEATGTNNRPVPLFRSNFEELYRRTAHWPIHYDAIVDEDGNAEAWSGGRPTRETSTKWAQQGYTLYLDPVPRSAMKLRLDVVQRFREYQEDKSDASVDVFPGKERAFKRWERLLEYMAVSILKGRSDEQQDPALMQMQSKMSLLNAWLDTRSIGGTPRVVAYGV